MEVATQEKKKRIKRVFSGIQDFVHLWAHQSQDEAKSRNAYFEGEVIYSYGRHFPIARIFNQKGKGTTVFFTTRTYSNTTAGHISCVRRAIDHLDIIYMQRVITEDAEYLHKKASYAYLHKDNVAAMVVEISNAIHDFKNRRTVWTKQTKLREARSEAANLEKYINFFKIRTKVGKKVLDLINDVRSDKYYEQINEFQEREEKRKKWEEEHPTAAQERRRKAREAKDRAELKANAERIEKWRNFEPYIYHPYERGRRGYRYSGNRPDLLRYDPEKNRIETSQRVEVPAEAARRFYFYIKAVIARGGCVTTETCGYEIVGFSVKEITEEHIRVGCHRILMSEVEAMAEKLKWNQNG